MIEALICSAHIILVYRLLSADFVPRIRYEMHCQMFILMSSSVSAQYCLPRIEVISYFLDFAHKITILLLLHLEMMSFVELAVGHFEALLGLIL